MKSIFIFVVISLVSISSYAANETGLKIIKVGAWGQGSPTFYITVDRTIGPPDCRSNLLKIDLGSDSDDQSKLMAKNMVRSMALAAFASNSLVEIRTLDVCLYNNPTFNQIWLHK